MLNKTKNELEITSVPEMFIFFKKGMRGAVSYISSRYSETNNKYLKSYNTKQDVNNLYVFTT